MKKSQRIANTIFKVGYLSAAVSILVRYISEIVSPTATYSSISSFEWLALGAMTIAFADILIKEKNAKKALNADA